MSKRIEPTFEVWKEIERRYIMGASLAELQRDYGIGQAKLSARLNPRVANLKVVAEQLAEVEIAFDHLPTEDQITARKLADDMRFISHTMARAGRMAAMTAARLTTEAEQESRILRAVTDDGRNVIDRVRVSDVTALMKSANIAAEIPLGLIRGNKEAFNGDEAPARKAQQLTDEELHKQLAQYGIKF